MEENYTEISLTGVMRAVLRKWRQILCFAVVIALVAGGVKALKLRSTEEAADGIVQEQGTEPAPEQNRLTYLEDSVKMQLDPYAVYTGTLTYLVDTHHVINMTGETRRDMTGSILAAYELALQDSAWREAVMEEIDPELELIYFNEVLSVSHEEQLLTFSCQFSDPQAVHTILEAAQARMAEADANVRQHYGTAYDLDLVSILELREVDQELLAFQEEQKAAYEEAMADWEEAAPAPAVNRTSAILKAVILGGFLGAFLSMGWYAVAYVCGGKVNREQDLEHMLSVPMLGMVENTGKHKSGLFGKLDRLIDSIGKGSIRGMTEAQQVNAVASGILLSCRDHDIQEVSFYGAGDCMGRELQQVEAILREKGLETSRRQELFADVDQLERLDKADGVVLLAREDVTVFERLHSEVKFCKDHGKNLLGVMLEV